MNILSKNFNLRQKAVFLLLVVMLSLPALACDDGTGSSSSSGSLEETAAAASEKRDDWRQFVGEVFDSDCALLIADPTEGQQLARAACDAARK